VGEKYSVVPTSDHAFPWAVSDGLTWAWAFTDGTSAADACRMVNSAHATVLATAQAELAALRAKWEALRGECEAVRELGDWSANTHNPRSSEVESTMLRLLGEVIAARTLTDSTHALEEE